MNGFHCSTCGEFHEGYPDLGYDVPWYLHAIPADERARRCVWDSDFCIMDGEHYFIRGSLEIPVHGRPQAFSWGVWMSLSETNFSRYRALYEADRSGEGENLVGWVSNKIPGFPDTLKLVARAHPRSGGLRPYIELEPTDHPLAVEQREGISLARLQAIYEMFLHQDLA